MKDFWRVISLLLIGVIIGFLIGQHYEIPKHKSVTTIRDSVIFDTAYVQIHLTKENVLAQLNKYNIPHPDIVLRQSIHETNHYTSNVCRKYNNIFGIMKGGKYVKYNSWNDCIKDYKNKISKRYKSGDYYEFLTNLGYAEDPDYVIKLKKIKIT